MPGWAPSARRDSLPDISAAIGTTIAISSHDAGGTTTNTRAVFALGALRQHLHRWPKSPTSEPASRYRASHVRWRKCAPQCRSTALEPTLDSARDCRRARQLERNDLVTPGCESL